MKKILFIFGTRPEALKLAPIIKEFQGSQTFSTKICVSGQHREMLDEVLDLFKIKTDFDMDLMKNNQDLTSLAGLIIDKAGNIIDMEKPDLIIVHGDTTTAMATSIAAFYKGIDVVHVEAGLRTSSVKQPFPEEFNRRIISKASSINFCPTELNKRNLIDEGINNETIFVTGNSAIDALLIALAEKQSDEHFINLKSLLGFDIRKEKYILITGHRRENQGDKFDSIFTAISKLTDNYSDLKIVYPVHLSPPVQKQAKKHFGNSDQIKLISPLNYFDFASLMQHSFFILTDSGGIQEEAPILNIPVVVFREETERKEGLAAGTILMGGVDQKDIYNLCERLLQDKEFYEKVALSKNPYGDGKSRYIMLNIIERYLSGESLNEIQK